MTETTLPCDSSPLTSGTSTLNIPEEHDFVIVNYVCDINVEIYMGKIISIAPDRILFIRFMRNYEKDIYHFPDNDDMDHVALDAIQKRIVEPIHLRSNRNKFMLD